RPFKLPPVNLADRVRLEDGRCLIEASQPRTGDAQNGTIIDSLEEPAVEQLEGDRATLRRPEAGPDETADHTAAAATHQQIYRAPPPLQEFKHWYPGKGLTPAAPQHDADSGPHIGLGIGPGHRRSPDRLLAIGFRRNLHCSSHHPSPSFSVKSRS